MEERYVFVGPSHVDAFMQGIRGLGIETDTEFRVDAPNGNILLHIRGSLDALARMESLPGYAWSTDRLA